MDLPAGIQGIFSRHIRLRILKRIRSVFGRLSTIPGWEVKEIQVSIAA